MWGISKEHYGIQKNKLKQCKTNREQNSLENRLYSPFQKQQKCFSKIPLSSLIKKKKKGPLSEGRHPGDVLLYFCCSRLFAASKSVLEESGLQRTNEIGKQRGLLQSLKTKDNSSTGHFSSLTHNLCKSITRPRVQTLLVMGCHSDEQKP